MVKYRQATMRRPLRHVCLRKISGVEKHLDKHPTDKVREMLLIKLRNKLANCVENY